jgi:hypothetical protein
MRVKLIAVTLFCLTLGCVSVVLGEEKKEQSQGDKQYRVVFSIFDKSSAGKYAYLRDSIQAMLAGRLAANDGVYVLEKTFSQEELNSLKKKGTQSPLSIGGEKADYLLTGELFALTGGLEILVDLHPLVPEKEVLHFSVLGKTPDTLIADVEQLAQDIAQTAFGVKPFLAGQETKDGTVGGSSGFVTVHPEAAYKKNVHTGTIIGVAGSGVTTTGKGARQNAKVPVDMRVLAVGDVTGDGLKDILLLAGSSLRLFGIRENGLVQVAETSLPATLVSHALNLADLDGDGKEEIYISATDGLYVASMIMKYDLGAGFSIVARNIPWYLRPLLVPGKGWQLAGQQRGIEKIDLVRPGISLVSLDADYKVIEGNSLPLPPSVNLFDFTYADLDGDGFYEIVAVDQKEKLRVYSPGNELMWVSKNNFASSKIYLGPSRGEATSESDTRNFTVEEDALRELIFVPGRIVVTDINKDGRQEIVVSEGDKVGLGYFSRLRFYVGGAVVSLAWNGATLDESWRTGNFKGYVAGYGFTLMDETQLQERKENAVAGKTQGRLFVGHLPKSGSLAELLPGSGETELTVYDIEFSHEKTEK